jgi:hypothetical protein
MGDLGFKQVSKVLTKEVCDIVVDYQN